MPRPISRTAAPVAPILAALILTLSACAALNTLPAPRDIRLSQGALEVRMSDATQCTATAPQTGVSIWEGTLDGCPAGYRYLVEIDPRSNILRRVVELVVKAVAPDAELPPIASVTITDPNGQIYEFVSPRPVE